jgi:hypothetical protein
MSTFTDYMTIANNLGRYQTMTASDPTVAQATKYFQANIGSITTPAQLVNNSRIFNYVMTAFGLGDMTYAKTLIQKVLEQGTASSTTLANTLNNPKILALAQAFNFRLYGADVTKTLAATTDVVNQYVMQTLEANQGQQSPGVQLALYFQQNASRISDGYTILADKNLLTVAQTALGISPYSSAENIDLQARQFDKLIDYSDFQSPTKLRNFLERFTAQYDLSNPGALNASANPAVTTLFDASSNAATGVSVDLMMSMQNLKLGGL